MRIYLRAAERIHSEENRFACTAINDAADIDRLAEQAKSKFEDLFSPHPSMRYGVWWADDDKDSRITALLLMHWISKDKR